jgi:glycosyltransferase involved in cell wall biosynthesis
MNTIDAELQKLSILETFDPSEVCVKPLVSVVVNTYNHEDFIEECIVSIIQQKVTFPIEVIVCDDESSDNTTHILKTLALRHSNLRLYHGRRENNIKLIDRPSGHFNALKGIQLAQGEYLAWMDGDDYWTDEDKLQKQFEAMQSNPHWSMCFTLGHLLYSDGRKEGVWQPDREEFNALECYTKLRSQELASSRFFRTKYFKGEVPRWFLNVFSDSLMDLWAATQGPIGWIPIQATCYRIHSSGIYQGSTSDFRTRMEFFRTQQLLLHGKDEHWLNPEFTKCQFKHLIKSFDDPCILTQFESMTLFGLLGFGAMQRLSLLQRLTIVGYWFVKTVQRRITQPIGKHC